MSKWTVIDCKGDKVIIILIRLVNVHPMVGFKVKYLWETFKPVKTKEPKLGHLSQERQQRGNHDHNH